MMILSSLRMVTFGAFSGAAAVGADAARAPVGGGSKVTHQVDLLSPLAVSLWSELKDAHDDPFVLTNGLLLCSASAAGRGTPAVWRSSTWAIVVLRGYAPGVTCGVLSSPFGW
jgi:hypothetical protein